MDLMRRIRLSGLPLALQIMGLLLGVLVIAQLVTLFLTLVLPPEPPQQYRMTDIARALADGAVERRGERPLQRLVRSAPPALSSPGWLESDRSRHELAQLLRRPDADVQLFFYTPLPFAGTALPRAVEYLLPPRFADGGVHLRSIRFIENQNAAAADGIIPVQFQGSQATPNGLPGGGFPGGFPGGGFPGGGSFPGTHIPPVSPGANFPRTSLPRAPGTPAPTTTLPQTAERLPGTVTPSAASRVPFPNQPGAALAPQGITALAPANPTVLRAPSTVLRVPVLPAPTLMPAVPAVPPGNFPESASAAPPQEPAPIPRTLKPHPLVRPEAPDVVTPILPAPAPEAVRPAPGPNLTVPAPEASLPLPPPPRGLFGLAPAPFVEGDFVAALKVSDGHWVVVQPQPEPFPNSWQQRVLLWFLLSFALVAPLGLLFARRLVRPITGFARAAERLGRDPAAPVLALEGPAEVGRAAHAFNRMQSRLRSFVDDRTAMIGAISHDLRTPLTRLRFRLEDVPEPLQAGMLAEVEEMEAMIQSVLHFIRDASEPGARERLDLRAIVEDVVEDAVFIGKDVRLQDGMHAPVDVDPLGMRRLFGNILENAVKYGDRAEVRLFTDKQDAVAEVRDNGPGLPEDELERVFQPFYRTPSARASKAQGSGLGLAVCRSIARAHGGDVQLKNDDRGLVVQVRLPLAYGMAS
jgi:signal transduction histidine kinase